MNRRWRSIGNAIITLIAPYASRGRLPHHGDLARPDCDEPPLHRLPRTKVTALLGEEALEGLVLRRNGDVTNSKLAPGGLLVFIGATPSTEWLNLQRAVNKDGFFPTGVAIPLAQLESVEDTTLPLETSRRRVFCVGDVRSRSINRVAAGTR